jgi:hypothetical protein
MQSILSSVPTSKVTCVREDARCLKVRCAKPLRAWGKRYVFSMLLGNGQGARRSENVAEQRVQERDPNESGKQSSVGCRAIRVADCWNGHTCRARAGVKQAWVESPVVSESRTVDPRFRSAAAKFADSDHFTEIA